VRAGETAVDHLLVGALNIERRQHGQDFVTSFGWIYLRSIAS
jgi:hypothetical protein